METEPFPTVDDQLLALAAHLTGSGYLTRLTIRCLWGEPDIRLLVRSGDGGPLVEVLGHACVRYPPQWWDAVRVHAGRRHVWRGPSRNCPLAEVGMFVATLLRLHPDQHANRYRHLG